MEDKQKQAQGNSFLLGVVVGVIITLLFTTKRGRVIFKEIVEKGIHKFSDLESILQDINTKDKGFEDPEDEAVHDDYVPTAPIKDLPPAPEPARKHVSETKVKQKVEVIKEEPVEEVVEEVSETVELEPPAPAHPTQEAALPAESVVTHKVEETAKKEDEEPSVASEKEKLSSAEASASKEVKPKTGKRWFRGLRRKK